MGHSLLAPSSMDRVIGCAASLAESDGKPNDGNKYTWEGTAAHTLASDCLTQALPTLAFMGRVIPVMEENKRGKLVQVAEFEVDEEIAGNVQIYVDKIYEYLSLSEDSELYVEQRVDFSYVVGEPDSAGTSDSIMLFPSLKLLHVADLKYGRGVKVDASYTNDEGDEEPNAQAASYALGALELFAGHDIENITMSIHQPRINHLSEFTMSVAELRQWAADKMIPACKLGIKLMKSKHVYGAVEDRFYNPNEDNCKFCKGKTTCKAIRREVVASIGVDFEDLDAEELDDKPAPIPVPDVA